MRRLIKKIEVITNVSVIVAVIVFVLAVGWLLLRHNSSSRTHLSSIPKGTKLTLPTFDWLKSSQTLLLVLSVDCKYCTASTPFYQRLANELAPSGKTRLIALLPQSENLRKAYLADSKVDIESLQASPASVGAKGTPTLILIDRAGVVIKTWEGLLPPEAENEVLLAAK